jgi:hypothetical protein
MTELTRQLQASALLMRLIGWGIILGGPILALAYPPGVIWGELPPGFPTLGPTHPPSNYAGAHPYLFMLFSLYLAWAILLVLGAKDPRAAASLFDFGILANLLHGLVMVIQVFTYPNEHAHLWADIPLLFAISAAMWHWHPNRKSLAGSA